MRNVLLTILAIVALGGLYVVLPVVAGVYRRYRGVKTPVCPETGERAAVEVDAGRAAATAVFGEPDLRVKQCSRWPENHECDEGCLKSVEEDARTGTNP